MPRPCPDPPRTSRVANLIGLALSGGGIRSASFNLGVLQGLAERDVLWMFDYLSTVSGGGFIGSWWSAWLSRTLRRPPTIFPPHEELEPSRRALTSVILRGEESVPPGATAPDGSRVARRDDPIHFLRLFSNYLTPKTGAFSPDTWRLVGFLFRNLLFTWIILLPILLAAVMAGQAYFLASEPAATAFLCDATDVRTRSLADPQIASEWQQLPVARQRQLATGYCDTPIDLGRETASGAVISDSPAIIRWKAVAKPLALGAVAYVTLSLLWLAWASSPFRLAFVSLSAVVALGWWVLPASGTSTPDWTYRVGVPAAVVATLALHFSQAFFLLIRHRRSRDRGQVRASSADYRAVLGKQQATLLKLLVFGGLLLVFSAFGHEVIRTLAHEAMSLKGAAGWGGVLTGIVSAAYTVMKALPTTHGTQDQAPGKLGTALMALAPPAAATLLALAFASLAHGLLRDTANQPRDERLTSLVLIAVWMGALQVVFALFESYQDPATPPAPGTFFQRFVPDSFAARTASATDRRDAWIYLFSPRGWVRVSVLMTLLVLAYAAPGGLWPALIGAAGARGPATLALLMLVVASGATFARHDWRVALGSARPAGLLAITTVTALFVLLAANPRETSADGVFLVAPLWIVLLVGFVICTGWLADPNLLSLHGFYKGRLSRAYLGASNTARNNEDVTDAAPGDDLPLVDVWNHDCGAPYHLVNTTLSLVGGSDLAMSQRSAENFVMSRYHCGSARASYRCTAEYMNGQLSLGTAAAISGAAVSPNMGSSTPSAAMALFLSLFNLRLGYWIPTPSGRRWREPHARLWPFYVLRETLSSTGQMGTYCYLTDGGHFDNTGIYALVERGCRYIVVCDCGADPDLQFADIGVAIRRCRIDFGTEIDLDVDGFAARRGNRTGTTNVVWGTIRYSEAHLALLDLDPSQRDGVIVWIKPTVTAASVADVRQYQLQNADFPQQSTADQWYDESQFESYRRLGMESAVAAFADLEIPGPPLPAPGQFDDAGRWFDAHVQGRPSARQP